MGNNTAQVCQYSIALMGGNPAFWMDCLELQGEVLAMFPDFACMFIDQYAPLDNKNIA